MTTLPDLDVAQDTGGIDSLFEEIWVISLRRRPDRLSRFQQNLAEAGWPFGQPRVYEAIDGDKVGVPQFWQTGGGSYGCLRSHLNLLERALQRDVGSLLVLEDDAEFMPGFGGDVRAFLDRVPSDWQCLMLGGQHVNSLPIEVSPGVLRAGAGGGIQRTHCYALRGREVMQALYRTWCDAAVHCDWVMGPCVARYHTYAPEPFLVGQAQGPSDISGTHNPPKFWRSAAGTEPVVVLDAPRAVMEALRQRGWHSGFTRDPATGLDEGLAAVVAETAAGSDERASRLRGWIDVIQNEVVSMAKAVCTVWHPDIKAEAVRPLVRGRTIAVAARSVEEALAQLPDDLRPPGGEPASPTCRQVILLRSDRATMEVLRDQGWHTGYWRDEVTGMDNGVRQALSGPADEATRRQKLRKVVDQLDEEAKQIPNGRITLWHDEVTADLLRADDVEIVEIRAGNPAQALQQLKTG